MNGLIWKDVVLLKSALVYIAVFGIVFSLLFSESNVMGIVCPMLFSSLVSSSFAWDDQCKWDQFAVSAGIGRRSIVIAKFGSSLIFVTIGAVLGFVVSVAMQTINGTGYGLESIAVVSVTGWVLGLLVVSISILVNYWTGSSVKAQYVSIIVLMASIAFLVSATMIASDILGGNMLAVTAVLIVVMLVIMAASYKASCARFEARDL